VATLNPGQRFELSQGQQHLCGAKSGLRRQKIAPVSI
jgi:hypothetical protein